MKKILGIGWLISALLLSIGCGSDNSSSSSRSSGVNILDKNQSKDCNSSVDINGTPMSKLTQELKDAIAYMGNEERLAYDVYHNLYIYHLENSGVGIFQLKNISEGSESQHIGVVQDIVRKYSIEPDELTVVEEPVANRDIDFKEMPSGKYGVIHIQELYNLLYSKGIESQIDALEVGCIVEVTDVNDLDRYITLAKESNATDILDAFEFLRSGSYNHYWAFDSGLKNLGVTNGCCSLGTVDGVNYCRPDFPNSENSQGGGQGQGQGHGNGRNR